MHCLQADLELQSERAELFSGVKNSSDMSSAAQHLLRERSALGASHAAADAAIGCETIYSYIMLQQMQLLDATLLSLNLQHSARRSVFVSARLQ